MTMEPWVLEPRGKGDKEITIYAGPTVIKIDFDDLTEEESEVVELIAEFIATQQDACEKYIAEHKE